MPDSAPSPPSEAPAPVPARQPARAPETDSIPTRYSVPTGGDALPPPTDLPDRLGRYRITAKLGEGGFGVVYRGYDDDLRRDVAIKVPHRHRVRSAADAEEYLAEARVLAGLDHPGIVPVFDLGRTDAPTVAPTPTEDRRPVRVVPKGLRSFDAGDADFFLDLLPGPRDRDGLPESLRFWKTRIEETYYRHPSGVPERALFGTPCG
jgi:hypothetical protein